MKHIIKVLLLITLLHATIDINAQNKIASLNIGDKIPDVVIEHILNHQRIKLSNLSAQGLLIVNFWATWCVPCIREIPLLDSLVAANQTTLKVLSVAYEDETTVKTFLKKHSELSTRNLLIATDDKILIEYFKHRVIPHNIWIDSHGIIKNITGSEEITSKNILSFINSGELKDRNKIDLIDFNMYKTFHLKDSDFLYRSILTGFTDGINGGVVYQTVWGHPAERWLNRIFSFNSSKKQLLWRALNQMNSYNDYYGVMKIQTNDSTRFFWPDECPKTFAASKYHSKQEWEMENAYCYELSLPKAVIDSTFYGYMKSDLERAFQVNIRVQTQKIPCSVLTVEGKHDFPILKNDTSYIDLNSTGLKAHNISILHLFHFLNEKVKADINDKPLDPPYIDKTGIEHSVSIDLEFPTNGPDLLEIKQLLKIKYGFNTKIAMHEYPIFIVKDLAQ
jgi:thiol-disulfide isomerase/thioredoxin